MKNLVLATIISFTSSYAAGGIKVPCEKELEEALNYVVETNIVSYKLRSLDTAEKYFNYRIYVYENNSISGTADVAIDKKNCKVEDLDF